MIFFYFTHKFYFVITTLLFTIILLSERFNDKKHKAAYNEYLKQRKINKHRRNNFIRTGQVKFFVTNSLMYFDFDSKFNVKLEIEERPTIFDTVDYPKFRYYPTFFFATSVEGVFTNRLDTNGHKIIDFFVLSPVERLRVGSCSSINFDLNKNYFLTFTCKQESWRLPVSSLKHDERIQIKKEN